MFMRMLCFWRKEPIKNLASKAVEYPILDYSVDLTIFQIKFKSIFAHPYCELIYFMELEYNYCVKYDPH